MRRDPQAAIDEFEMANQIQPNESDVVLTSFRRWLQISSFPEAEKLAVDFLQKEKTYGAMYDMLYLEYARQNRLADGEKLLRLKVENKFKENGMYVTSWPRIISCRKIVRPWTK